MVSPPFFADPIPGSVLRAGSTQSPDRERHLLRLLAETFEFELERERQLRLEGAALLPPEWTAYLESERQAILGKIFEKESRDEGSTSSSDEVQSSLHAEYLLRTASPTAVPHRDLEVQNDLEISDSIRRISESAGGLDSAADNRQEEGLRTDVDPRSLSNTTTVGAGRPHPSRGSPLPSPLPPIVGHCPNSRDFDDERASRSPTATLDFPGVDAGEHCDKPLQVANTHRNQTGVEETGYQPLVGMFNSAHSATIHGGVFYFVQGNVSRCNHNITSVSLDGQLEEP